MPAAVAAGINQNNREYSLITLGHVPVVADTGRIAGMQQAVGLLTDLAAKYEKAGHSSSLRIPRSRRMADIVPGFKSLLPQ